MPPEMPPKKPPFTLTDTVRKFVEVVQLKIVGLQSVGDSDVAAEGTNVLSLLPLPAPQCTRSANAPTTVALSADAPTTIALSADARTTIAQATTNDESEIEQITCTAIVGLYEALPTSPILEAPQPATTNAPSASQISEETPTMTPATTTPSRQFFATTSQRRAAKRKMHEATQESQPQPHSSESHPSQSSSHSSQSTELRSMKNAILATAQRDREELHAIQMQIKREELATKREFRTKLSTFMDVAIAKLQDNSVFNLIASFRSSPSHYVTFYCSCRSQMFNRWRKRQTSRKMTISVWMRPT